MHRHTATFERQIRISAPPSRVWQALCHPEEVAQWDSGVQLALDAPPDYPQPGQRVRWRTTGRVFRTLVDEPQEVIEERRLRSHLSLGPARYDEAYTIWRSPVSAEGVTENCLLQMTMTLWVVGVPWRQLLFRRFSATTPQDMESALTAIKDHCESYHRTTVNRI